MSFQNIQRTHRFEPAAVQGHIPPELRGTLFRAGPGLFERNGRRIAHPFLADGAIAAVRFEDGRATRAARFVEGSHFREEEAAGRFLYAEGGGWFRRLWHSVRGTVKCTGNTSLFTWQGRMFALMEGGHPVEMSTETLDTLGERIHRPLPHPAALCLAQQAIKKRDPRPTMGGHYIDDLQLPSIGSTLTVLGSEYCGALR